MYDRLGHRAEEPGSPFGQGGPFAGGFVDISDIAVDGILGDLLGVFGVGRGERPGEGDGLDGALARRRVLQVPRGQPGRRAAARPLDGTSRSRSTLGVSRRAIGSSL